MRGNASLGLMPRILPTAVVRQRFVTVGGGGRKRQTAAEPASGNPPPPKDNGHQSKQVNPSPHRGRKSKKRSVCDRTNERGVRSRGSRTR
ncbi:uncharacterized protein LY79DRAFT_571019 [Colletotrichum navitas]|uniref:Uncharacterized protein n=1 Tax=Colletotrichum navitas TaxID=681940 RepID=A0AAD8UYN6_9PEZI|nr:uncharacterized protein LY79DRAFT_571019 [Colletotrichum navitas]KAK1569882.1 hypothetical protein LY79DRAFT_571019 [Colletotrichum navitas]